METKTPLLKDAIKSNLSMNDIVTNVLRHTGNRFFCDNEMKKFGTRLTSNVYTNGKGLHFFVTSEKRGTMIPGNTPYREYHTLWYDETTHKISFCYLPKWDTQRTEKYQLRHVFTTQRQADSFIRGVSLGLVQYSQD